jgi:hypothetical protein
MNNIHTAHLHVVKVEQEQRLARLELQRQAMSHSDASDKRTQRVPLTLVPRRLATAAATALLALALIAGAAFAAATGPGAAPAGAPNIPGGGGGGGVHLLR